MRRFVWRAGLGALVILSAGCAADSPSPAANPARERWERLSQRMQRSPAAESRLQPPIARPAEADLDRLAVVAAKIADAVVSIETLLEPEAGDDPIAGTARQTGTISGGTGVIIDPSGMILTNAHVVRGAAQLTIVLPDGSRRAAQQWAIDSRHDLAVLRIASAELAALSARPQVPLAAATVVAIGRRVTGGPCQTRCGVVSRVSSSLQAKLCPSGRTRYDNLIESTAAIEPGFSGGPLLDSCGRWVGVNVAMFEADSAGASRAYAIPLDDAICGRIADLTSRLQTR